jgi:endogenous inhibitor of DNA gyrase (YacG/DUF329 family)
MASEIEDLELSSELLEVSRIGAGATVVDLVDEISDQIEAFVELLGPGAAHLNLRARTADAVRERLLQGAGVTTELVAPTGMVCDHCGEPVSIDPRHARGPGRPFVSQYCHPTHFGRWSCPDGSGRLAAVNGAWGPPRMRSAA